MSEASTTTPTSPETAAPGRYDAFVSYSRIDTPVAERVRDALAARGKEIWIDVENILGGADWRPRVRRGIEACGAFLFVLSPASLRSEQCMEELQQAVALNKLVIPVRYRETEAKVPSALAAREWISLRDVDDFDRGIDKLIVALETDLDWRDQHTRLAVRTREWIEAGHHRSLLLRGPDLRTAEAWLGRQAGPGQAATAEQGQFIIASRRTASARQTGLTIGVVAVAVLAGLLAAWALAQRHEAISQRREAIAQRDGARSRSLAAAAERKLEGSADVAGLLSLEAYRAKPTNEARDAVLASIQALGTRAGTFQCRGDYTELLKLALSRDGSTVDCAAGNGIVDRWGLRPIHEIGGPRRLARLSRNAIDSPPVAFSSDGKKAAAADRSGLIRIWDLATRQREPVRLGAHAEEVSYLAFSPDGKTLAAAGYKGKIVLWSVRAHKRLGGALAHTDAFDLAFTDDGKKLAWADLDGGVEIWDLAKRKRVRRFQREDTVLKIAFDAHGRRLASTDNTGTVRVFDTRTGKLLAAPPSGNISGVIALSPDGELIAYLNNSGNVAVWSFAAAGFIAQELKGPTYGFGTLIFSQDGSTLAGLDGTGTVQLWRMRRHAAFPRTFPRQTARPGRQIDDLDFRHDGKVLASSDLSSVRLWNLGSEQPLGKSLRGTPDARAAFSAADRLFVLPLFSLLQAWRPTSYGAVRQRAPIGRQLTTRLRRAQDVELSPFGNALAFQLKNGRTGVVDLLARKTRYIRLPRRRLDVVTAFRPDGKELAVANGSHVRRYSVATGKTTGRLQAFTATVEALAYSPDGETLASAPADQTIQVWDLRRDRREGLPLVGYRGLVFDLTFSPDGKVLAASGEAVIRLWDIDHHRPLGTPLAGHAGQVFAVAFSPDGKTLASGSSNGTIQLWDSILWSDNAVAFNRRVCASVRRSLTRLEWDDLVPDQPYHKTCAAT